jgi:hypothetical protein
MLPLRSATAIIALITVAVSAIAIFAGLDYFVAMGGFVPARLSGLLQLPGALPVLLTWSPAPSRRLASPSSTW